MNGEAGEQNTRHMPLMSPRARGTPILWKLPYGSNTREVVVERVEE